MAEIASAQEPGWKRDAYGIAGLVTATLLILASGAWPYGYYQFLRIATCAFSIAVAYRAYQADSKRWLIFAVIGAVLFNPIIPFRTDKGDWSLVDLIFAIGFGAYGVGVMRQAAAKIVSIPIWVVFAGTFGVGYYVNHYMPHGPSYPTGDFECTDTGHCGEVYEEDMRGLDIPGWAKFLRDDSSSLWALLLSATAGYFLSTKARDEDDQFE